MKSNTYTVPHNFYIPVMGTAFTIDTPLKVGKFGISSVVSLCDDELCETMRAFYASQYKKEFSEIPVDSEDSRARRICAYLNLLHDILNDQIEAIKKQAFIEGSELSLYFQLLPEDNQGKKLYLQMLNESNAEVKIQLQKDLREFVRPGHIDVNIMTKLDKDNKSPEGEILPKEFSDACAALRGFATSNLNGNIVFSAGFNRRLYAYCEAFKDFYPDEEGYVKKGIILKVSDFRSTQIQGTFFAKKGLWVKEYRIESGLNCGGHAFATDGLLIGPILQQFKDQKNALDEKLYQMIQNVLEKQKRPSFQKQPKSYLTYQGGLGTSEEVVLLQNQYNVDATGWGSPFLLVPEVTTLQMQTRELLVDADESSFYLSGISPLGVPFNTVRGTESEQQKLERFELGKPGSPCPKGFLKIHNTEFTKVPVCEASIFYQKRKIKQLQSQDLNEASLKKQIRKVIDKACLCEDLAASALQINDICNKRPLKTAVCPGPNLAYFKRLYKLNEMIPHIYGKLNILKDVERPHFFVKEAQLYLSYFESELEKCKEALLEQKYILGFYKNFQEGVQYYLENLSVFNLKNEQDKCRFKDQIKMILTKLDSLKIEYHSCFEMQVA